MRSPSGAGHGRVDHLWAAVACESVWGEGLPSPARLAASRLPDRALSGDASAFDAAGPLRHHLAAVVERVRAFDRGARLGPVTIGPDGRLAGGSHDLTALYLRRADAVSTVGAVADAPRLEEVFRPKLLHALAAADWTRAFDQADPYPFAYLNEVLQPAVAAGLRNELGAVGWRHENNELYEQDVATLLDCNRAEVGGCLLAFRTAVLSYEFAALAGSLLGMPVRVADIACHRSRAGHLVRVHTDHSNDGEVCRLTVHFNLGWRSEDGGEFLQFRDRNGLPVAAWPPEMNTAVLFRISARSHHAVSRWAGAGVRYSVVVAFAAVGQAANR